MAVRADTRLEPLSRITAIRKRRSLLGGTHLRAQTSVERTLDAARGLGGRDSGAIGGPVEEPRHGQGGAS